MTKVSQQHFRPVTVDGDSALANRGSVSELMEDVAAHALLPDGSFAMTNGEEQPDGSFLVLADSTGDYLGKYFEQHGPETKTEFDAWAERAKLASGQLELPEDLVERGGVKQLNTTKPELIAINARGELGKPNLLAVAVSGEDRVGIFEKQGQVFTVRKRESAGKTVYHAFSVEGGNYQGVGRNDIKLDLIEHNGVSALSAVVADTENHPVELQIEPTSGASEAGKVKNGWLRGIYRNIRDKKAAKVINEPEFLELEVAKAIDLNVSQKLADRHEKRHAEETKWQKALQEKIEKESVSIEKLSSQYPLAGNLFQPGASLFEDQLWIDLMAHHGVDHSGEQFTQELNVVMKDPIVRSDVKVLLQARLEAWCSAMPAQHIQEQLSATKELESHFGISHPYEVKKQYPKDSLIHYASSDRRTIANMIVPDGVYSNRMKRPNAMPEHGHPISMQSRDYVVALALAMLDGSFDTRREDTTSHDARYTDAGSRVVIHKAHIMQHRTAANLILYGRC